MKIILVFIAFVILALFSCGCISSEQPKIVNNSQPISITVSPSLTLEQVSVPAPSPTISPELASYQKGLELYKTGNYQEAIEAFNTTISVNKTNGEAYFARGKTFHQIGLTKFYETRGNEEFEQAISDFGDALHCGLNSGEILEAKKLRGYSNYYLGENKYISFFLEGENSFRYYEMAASDFSWVLEHDPDNVDALIGRSLAYCRIGVGTAEIKYPSDQHKSELARRDAQRALQLAPKNAWTHYALAKIYEIIDKLPPEDIIKEYDKAVYYNSEESLFYLERGELKLKVHDYDGAEWDFSKALEMKPRFALVYLNLGILESKQDKREEALVNMQKALEINPNMARWWGNFGRVQFNQLNPATTLGLEEVLQSTDRAIAIDPYDPQTHYTRWFVLVLLHRIPEANEEIRIFKNLELSDPVTATYMEAVSSDPYRYINYKFVSY
jgi:tetratricopeptide (TPR) repeat protein